MDTHKSPLDWPEKRPDFILDTDTYNEIDDQFALAYALLARDRFNFQAVHAAPFHNERSQGPQDGMEKSVEEIHRVLDSADASGQLSVLKGSTRWLDPERPEASEATEDLIERAASTDSLLYVGTIGAPTNIANAILLKPEIKKKLVVLWLGGHPYNWHKTDEFNMKQDLPASRTMLSEGVNLVRFPCAQVAAHLKMTHPELRDHVKGRGKLGDYLFQIYDEYERMDLTPPWKSKVLWDIIPIAWLVNPDWVPTGLIPCPLLTDNLTWSHDPRRHLVREALTCSRDAIFADLFRRLPEAS